MRFSPPDRRGVRRQAAHLLPNVSPAFPVLSGGLPPLFRALPAGAVPSALPAGNRKNKIVTLLCFILSDKLVYCFVPSS